MLGPLWLWVDHHRHVARYYPIDRCQLVNRVVTRMSQVLVMDLWLVVWEWLNETTFVGNLILRILLFKFCVRKCWTRRYDLICLALIITKIRIWLVCILLCYVSFDRVHLPAGHLRIHIDYGRFWLVHGDLAVEHLGQRLVWFENCAVKLHHLRLIHLCILLRVFLAKQPVGAHLTFIPRHGFWVPLAVTVRFSSIVPWGHRLGRCWELHGYGRLAIHEDRVGLELGMRWY